MNIWSLDKDQSIRHLLLLLSTRLGEHNFVVDEGAKCDSRAVFLHHPSDPRTRVYLYTVGQAEGRYGMHLEYPPTATAANLLEMLENQTLEAVVDSLAVHFDIASIAPLPGR